MMPALTPNQIAVALSAYLDRYTGSQPFDWAVNNCAHFAMGWWQRATGCDALAGIAMPHSAEAARRWLRGQGASLAHEVAVRTGRSAVDARLAAVGDLVIVGRQGLPTGCTVGSGLGSALGICTGRLAALLGADGRVQHLPMAAALCAFALRAAERPVEVSDEVSA
jgi:hypothetical protein